MALLVLLINDLDGSGVTYDNTTPTIDNITFTSNNSVNNAYAKPGDITLTFDASEASPKHDKNRY